jgi:hypothetical protein
MLAHLAAAALTCLDPGHVTISRVGANAFVLLPGS